MATMNSLTDIWSVVMDSLSQELTQTAINTWFCAEEVEQVKVGTGHAAVVDVAEDAERLSGEVVSPDLAQGVAVKESLRGMGVPAVTRVDDAAGQELRKIFRRAACGMADDDDVGIHGHEGLGRILECLALVYARSGFGEGEGVGGKAFARHVETCLGARAVFGKEEHYSLALEGRDFFDRAPVDFLKAGGKVQKMYGVFPAELAHIKQVLMFPEVSIVVVHSCPPAGPFPFRAVRSGARIGIMWFWCLVFWQKKTALRRRNKKTAEELPGWQPHRRRNAH